MRPCAVRILVLHGGLVRNARVGKGMDDNAECGISDIIPSAGLFLSHCEVFA